MKLAKTVSAILTTIRKSNKTLSGYAIGTINSMSHPGIIRSLTELRKEGFVTRELKDKRTFNLFLTDKGKIAADSIIGLEESGLKL